MVLVAGAEARPGGGSARVVHSAKGAGAAGTDLYERPATKYLVVMIEAEHGAGAFIPGTIFDLERTLPERSRVSGAETRIHTDTRICRL